MLQLCICRDIEHLGSLESTQEARVAQGALLRLFHVLQTSCVLSILTLCTLMHELIVNWTYCTGFIPLAIPDYTACLKTIPFTAADTYIAHIWQYPPNTPPPPTPGVFPPFTHMLTTKIITDKKTFMVYTTSNLGHKTGMYSHLILCHLTLISKN